MRYLLLAGAALLSLSAAPAMAQHHHHNSSPYLVPAVTVLGCAWAGLEAGAPQVQCATNYVADPGHHNSNDRNTQGISQTQTLDLPNVGRGRHHRGNGGVDDTLQLQLGANIVVHGNDNTQSITQTQSLTDSSSSAPDGLQQVQGALNAVESGNGNSQTITQSQTSTIGGNSD